MKKLTLTLCALTAVVSASFAGTSTYTGKEMKQVETPCPSWYADNEWNIGISFAYAANVSDDGNDNNVFFFGDDSWDDAFGGSLDVKYFFHRYWGVGIQGIALAVDNDNNNFVGFNDDDDDFAGAALATFTFRYAAPCSRFAPYLWVGVGGFFDGDDNNNNLFVITTTATDISWGSSVLGLKFASPRMLAGPMTSASMTSRAATRTS